MLQGSRVGINFGEEIGEKALKPENIKHVTPTTVGVCRSRPPNCPLQWNFGDSYKVKYEGNIFCKALWVDSDKMKVLEDRMSQHGTAGAISWIKDKYRGQQLAQLTNMAGCPF